MSAYRSELPLLERRVRELEQKLADLAIEEQHPILRERRLRDVRVHLVGRLVLLAAATLGLLAAGIAAGTGLLHDGRVEPAAPASPPPPDTRTIAQHERCSAARRMAEVELHDCEVSIRPVLVARAIEISNAGPEADAEAHVLLARYAPSVLTCSRGQTVEVDVDFTLPLFPNVKVAPLDGGDDSCVRGALASLSGSGSLTGQVLHVRFRAPGY